MGGRITRDIDGCLGPKNLSTPIHRVDESLRTQMGAFVLKIIKPYPRGERINRDPDEPESLHQVLPKRSGRTIKDTVRYLKSARSQHMMNN